MDAGHVDHAGTPYVSIFESELNLIAGNAANWGAMETGGDLFGTFSHAGRPIIFLASPPGPGSRHEKVHFQQNPDITRELSDTLGEMMGLQFIGNHHSHHQLGLKMLSPGDINSMQVLARKNGYRKMCQLLVTFNQRQAAHYGNALVFSPKHPASVTINAYFYENAQSQAPAICAIKVLPGMSPARQALGAYGRKFEFHFRHGFQSPSLRYQRHQPQMRAMPHRHQTEDATGQFLQRLAVELQSLPYKVNRNIRYEHQNQVFILSLPVTRTANLVFGIVVKPKWEIVSLWIGSSKPGCQPIDLGKRIGSKLADQTIPGMYHEASRLLRGNRYPNLWHQTRYARDDEHERMGCLRLLSYLFGGNKSTSQERSEMKWP